MPDARQGHDASAGQDAVPGSHTAAGQFADVAVDAPVRPGQTHGGTFSYSIPPGMSVQPGHIVEVPFGPKQLSGIVFALTPEPAVPHTRPITRVIDAAPWLTGPHLALASWMSERYRCPLYYAASLMTPPGFRQKAVAVYGVAPDEDVAARATLTPEQAEALEFVRRRGRASQAEMEEQFGKRKSATLLARLRQAKLAVREWAWAKPQVQPKFARMAALAVTQGEALASAARMQARAPKQAAVLRAVAEGSTEGVPLAILSQEFDGAWPALEALAARGLVRTEQVRAVRDPLAGREYPRTTAPALTPEQAAAWREIETAMRQPAGQRHGEPAVFLLFGVTGSGKTELYLRAVEEAVAQGKRGIVLTPEIALTPQTIERFSGRFPGRVAVLHSELSPGEQFDEWWRIQQGEFDVVIGSRGAIFAPLGEIGVIVLDEEHEWTYKEQEREPRYHAREVAAQLAALTGATVILGSATPGIESFHRAHAGQYRLLELPRRILDNTSGAEAEMGALPSVTVADMREELKAGNRSIFSRVLREAMEQSLAQDEQVILFLNRRGAATFVQCRACGYVARCRRCDATMTFHDDAPPMRCHQCNYHTEAPVRCPDCGSAHIRYMGLGTQRLEQEVQKAFPAARTLRWDRDVTGTRGAHEAILQQFREHRANVLIGTQMLAKGLHLPRVTLVGAVNADIGLYAPDFRAAERVFQTLCQVAGRSGRGEAGGRVVLQTYQPDHYAIAAATMQDYRSFYDQEIAKRMELALPPFTRLVRLVYHHSNAGAARREAERVHGLLQQRLAQQGFPSTGLVGPAPAPYERIRGRYRWHILVRGPDPPAVTNGIVLPEGWTVDIDPVQVM
ncbi:MAG: primosomal protein N' [Dehalococcoidia bacterium]|nr:primosomal protein N' [Dehalococcoidia bacterium]